MKLTKSEEIAKNWLEGKGFSDIEKIEEKGCPDFETNAGLVEVKRNESGSIYFSEPQIESFKKLNPLIVVVGNERVEDSFNFQRQTILVIKFTSREKWKERRYR